MISQCYRLYAPKKFRIDLVEEHLSEDDVVVKPTYLSICAADLRYFSGNRNIETLNKKLPMALIHEAVGEVIYDPRGKIKKGTKVVMIPNTPVETDKIVKENYLRSSKFKSSGIDGFMRSIVCMSRERVIEYKKVDDRIAAMFELLSVSMNALEHFTSYSHNRKQVLGIWGCGNVGFCTALVLKYTFPNAKIIVFGTNMTKLSYFSFADEVYTVDNVPKGLTIDHAFECVGGTNAEDAINQIIDLINPQGSISLLGVSENRVGINTRMVLEKGLTLLGNSRSGYEDFKAAIDFLERFPKAKEYMGTIITEIININNFTDIGPAFEKSLHNDFKTVMKWNL